MQPMAGSHLQFFCMVMNFSFFFTKIDFSSENLKSIFLILDMQKKILHSDGHLSLVLAFHEKSFALSKHKL